MQTATDTPIGEMSGASRNYALHAALRWVWKAAIVLAAVLALPASVGGAPAHFGMRQQGSLAFNFTSAANQTAQLSVAGDGSKTIRVTNNDETTAMTVSVTGRADENEIDIRVTDERDVTITLGYESGESITISLTAQPEGATVAIEAGASGRLTTTVIDPAYDRVGVSVALTGVDAESTLSITYDDLPTEESIDAEGRVTPRFPGFRSEEALGGSVTLSATGLSLEGAYVVSLFYAAGDVENFDESDIRVHRFENGTGAFEPVGDNDRGIGAASTGSGDFGVDAELDAAWSVVDQLGTFAVGVTDDTLPATVEDDELGGNGLGGNGRGICGALGTLGLLPILAGLAALRPRRLSR